MRTNLRNTPYRIDDIIEDIKSEKLCFDHPCQRKVGRWNEKQALRFINSMLQQYPIPSVCILNEDRTKKRHCYTVIDGNQRLHTIGQYFNVNIDTPWNFTSSNAPMGYLWLADIFVRQLDNGIEVYYYHREINEERTARLTFKENKGGKQYFLEDIDLEEKDQFLKPSYRQFKEIESALNYLSLRKMPSFWYGLHTKLREWSTCIENKINIGVLYVYLDRKENENDILSEIFDRLNYGRTPKPAELINNLSYNDTLWRLSSEFALSLRLEDKENIYGYTNCKEFNEDNLFPEFQSSDRSDELFWGEIFFSAYVYVLCKRNQTKKSAYIIPYYTWNVDLIREGQRCKDLKDKDINKIANTREDVVIEVGNMLKKSLSLVQIMNSHIHPKNRRKTLLCAVVLYCFYVTNKYNDPKKMLNDMDRTGKLGEVLSIIASNRKLVNVNHKTNKLIEMMGI